MCRSVLAVIASVLLSQTAVAQAPAMPTIVVPVATELPQVCPRPDAPFAQVPIGLITTSPNVAKVAVLHEKQAELARLQQEINQLRTETGVREKILIRVQMLEVSLTKMEKLGLDTSGVTSGSTRVSSAEAEQLVHTLLENNSAKIVAEPNILALDGQPTSIHSGGEIPYPAINGPAGATEMQPVGIKVDVLPQSLADNRVRMDLKVRKCTPDFAQTVNIHGAKAPVLNVEQMNTAVEAAYGQSVILNGLVETRIETIKRGWKKVENIENRIGSVFIVTPEIVSEVATAPKPTGGYAPK